VRRDKRGFVEVPAFVTRTGVLAYRRADGTLVRELRHPDHVFLPESLATLASAPVCVGHPGAGLEWVTPDNAHTHEVGVVSSHRREGNYVDATLSVRRADTIRRIDSKELVDVSAAYDADIDPTPGTWEGEPYDQVQTNITYNHVALLPPGTGRAGRDVRLRADSADAVIADAVVIPVPVVTPSPVPAAPPPAPVVVPEPVRPQPAHPDAPAAPSVVPAVPVVPSVPSVPVYVPPPVVVPPIVVPTTDVSGDVSPAVERMMTTRKLRVDGVEHELPETAASVLEKLVGERDAATKRADSAEAERDMVKADLTKSRDPQVVATLVQARVSLERDASKVLGTEAALSGLTDRAVREQVLKVAAPHFATEGRSDDALCAAFEYAMGQQTAGKAVNQGLKLVSDALSDGQKQSARADAADAVEKQLDELEEKRASAWKGAK
jgi:hypothetical protein